MNYKFSCSPTSSDHTDKSLSRPILLSASLKTPSETSERLTLRAQESVPTSNTPRSTRKYCLCTPLPSCAPSEERGRRPGTHLRTTQPPCSYHLGSRSSPPSQTRLPHTSRQRLTSSTPSKEHVSPPRAPRSFCPSQPSRALTSNNWERCSQHSPAAGREGRARSQGQTTALSQPNVKNSKKKCDFGLILTPKSYLPSETSTCILLEPSSAPALKAKKTLRSGSALQKPTHGSDCSSSFQSLQGMVLPSRRPVSPHRPLQRHLGTSSDVEMPSARSTQHLWLAPMGACGTPCISAGGWGCWAAPAALMLPAVLHAAKLRGRKSTFARDEIFYCSRQHLKRSTIRTPLLGWAKQR